MADARRLLVWDAFEAALNAASATPPSTGNTLTKPTGLIVVRTPLRTMQLADRTLLITAQPSPRPVDDAVGQLTWIDTIGVEMRKLLDTGSSADPYDAQMEELDLWCHIALMSDPTLGGVAVDIKVGEIIRAEKQEQDAIGLYGRLFDVTFITARDDPRSVG